MKSLRTRILPAAFALAAFGAAPALVPAAFAQTAPAAAPEKQNTDFANILPADDTAAVFVVQNLFKVAAFDTKSSTARLLAHPAVKQWTENILPKQLPDAGELRDALGLTEKDFPRLFSGKAVFASVIVKGKAEVKEAKPEAKPDDETGPDEAPKEGPKVIAVKAKFSSEAVSLVEFKGSAAEYETLADKLEAYLKSKDAKADVARERADGLSIRSYETDAAILAGARGDKGVRTKLFHALHNGVIIIAPDKSRLLDTVRALSRGATEKPLSGRSDFIAVKQEMGANDGFFLVNLAVVMPMMNETMQAALEDQTAANPQMKAFLDPATVVRSLALENFTTLYGSLNVEERGLEARYGLTWKDRAGVASLINFGPDAVKVPEYVSAEYKGLDVSTVDFPATLDAGIALFKSVSPGAHGMLNMLLASKPETEQLLASLRKGILDNLRPELVSLTGYASVTPADDEEPGKAWVLSLRDPAAAQAAIDAAFAMEKDEKGEPAVKPEVKEYLGVKINKLPEIPMPFSAEVAVEEEGGAGGAILKPQTARPAYAFVGDSLIITLGSDGLMEGVIANMKNPGKSLVDDRFKDGLGALPGTPCSVSYGDVGTYMKTAINETLKSGKYKAAKISKDDMIKARDACKDLSHYWVAKSFFNKDGVYGRLVLAERAESGK